MRPRPPSIALLACALLLASGTLDPASPVAAQAPPGRVQEITGRLRAGETDAYLLPALVPGDRLVVTMRSTAGDLDPAIGILDTTTPLQEVMTRYSADVQRLLAAGENVDLALDDLRHQTFLAWDDDGGEGYASALELVVPAAGETLFAAVEATSGDIRPSLILRDFGGKPLAAGNPLGLEPTAALEHPLPEDAAGHSLEVRAAPGPDGTATAGDYRLVVGRNEPEVLTGQASAHGNPVLVAPIEVQVGLKIDRISAVDKPVSRLTYNFDAPRHLNYYLLQVFLPIILIILISWFTFFLRDYTRRIEAAAANILLFIAFSWSLADNYPRLGYLTFLDAIMSVTFGVNVLVLLYNVYMKRLENQGRAERVERIDNVLDWAYPLMYVALIGLVVVWFF